LAGMSYLDIGFANIRLPNNENSYVYKYDSRRNTFPEEVYVHEFLHTMERISNENGLEYPFLHDNEKYGYKNMPLVGLKYWYGDYMKKNIKNGTTFIGLDSKVYSLKPIHNSCFENSEEIEFEQEPSNIIEELKVIMNAFVYGINILIEGN